MTGRRAGTGADLAAARDMPDGPAKTAELERIVAHADAGGDLRLGVDARSALMETYRYDGEPWRLFEPLHWSLAALDRAPALFTVDDADRLRAHQRAAVAALLTTARIGLDQALSTLDDLERRSGAEGPGDLLVAELRCRTADHVGDEPTAREWFGRWRATGTDPAGGCPGCTVARQAELLAGWGDEAAALRAVEPALDGTVPCTEQPERGLAAAMLPLLRLGRVEEAGRAHVRAYRRHRRERTAIGHLPAHLRFCALAGHLARGLDILAEQLPRMDRSDDELTTMEFAAAGALLCRLAGEAGLGDRPLLRPADGAGAADGPTAAALGARLLAVATDLAGRFDARNGTGHQSGRIAGWLAERPLAEAVPLPPDGDPDATHPDEAPPEPAEDEPVPLTVDLIAAALDRRGDRYAVDPAGTVVGRWGDALIQFRRLGEKHEILHARVLADRRLPADRLAEAYAFCNAWNHDRLLPKAYVHDPGEGMLVLAGDVSTDLEHGVAPAQLAILVDATLATGVAYAEAVAALP